MAFCGKGGAAERATDFLRKKIGASKARSDVVRPEFSTQKAASGRFLMTEVPPKKSSLRRRLIGFRLRENTKKNGNRFDYRFSMCLVTNYDTFEPSNPKVGYFQLKMLYTFLQFIFKRFRRGTFNRNHFLLAKNI